MRRRLIDADLQRVVVRIPKAGLLANGTEFVAGKNRVSGEKQMLKNGVADAIGIRRTQCRPGQSNGILFDRDLFVTSLRPDVSNAEDRMRGQLALDSQIVVLGISRHEFWIDDIEE